MPAAETRSFSEASRSRRASGRASIWRKRRAADMVLLAVPSQFLRGIAEQLRPVLREVPVVSCSEGIRARHLRAHA